MNTISNTPNNHESENSPEGQAAGGAMLITITRVEGNTFECNKPRTAQTFEEARSILSRMAGSAPKCGAYDKVDFTIAHAGADFEYKGTYDLKHNSVEAPDLQGHVVGYLKFYGGTAKPDDMTQSQYEGLISPSLHELQAYQDAAEWVSKQP